MEVGFTIATQPKCEKKYEKLFFRKQKLRNLNGSCPKQKKHNDERCEEKCLDFRLKQKKPTDRITNRQNYGKRIKNDEDEDIFLIKKHRSISVASMCLCLSVGLWRNNFEMLACELTLLLLYDSVDIFCRHRLCLVFSSLTPFSWRLSTCNDEQRALLSFNKKNTNTAPHIQASIKLNSLKVLLVSSYSWWCWRFQCCCWWCER